MLRRLERKTGIKASPHMLRHYFANARRKDGWKLEMISQALGHRNIETTMKYLNITEDELIEVSDAFYNRHLIYLQTEAHDRKNYRSDLYALRRVGEPPGIRIAIAAG